MSEDFQKRHMKGIVALIEKGTLMTVGQLQDALAGIDRDIEISLSFPPVEGGHRGPNVFGVPFIVDPVMADAGKIITVHLTEQSSANGK